MSKFQQGGMSPSKQTATYARPLRNTAVLFGTSVEAQNGLGPSTVNPATSGSPDAPKALCSRGWFCWLNGYLGNPFGAWRNAGVGGNTYADMRARLTADILTGTEDNVFMGGPVNDIANGRTFAQITADADFMLDAINAAGKRVFILTAAPSTSYDTSAKRIVLAQVNAWIRDLAVTRRNAYPADAWQAVVDPATGSPATGMASDGVIHWSSAGAQRVGKVAAAAWAQLIPKRPAREASALVDGSSLIANPHFAGPGTGWTPPNPTGLTVTYATAEDRWANKAILTIAGVNDLTERSVQYLENVSGGRFAPGDTIQIQARFKWSNLVPVSIAASCGPFLTAKPRDIDGGFTSYQPLTMASASANNLVPVGVPSSGEGVFTTWRGVLGPNVDRLYVSVGWQGAASGTIEISDLAPFKI